MAISTQDNDLNDPLRNIGPDSTAVFDESASNPTEHASSENLGAASELEDDVEDEDEGEDDDVEEDLDEDDDDEDDEEEDGDDEDDEEGDEDELQVAPRR
jgi:hypothetical protein